MNSDVVGIRAFDADFAVTELVVYDEVAGRWRVAGRPRFGMLRTTGRARPLPDP